jgi:GTP pyrophosphokinase
MSTEWIERTPKDGLIRRAYDFAEKAHAGGKRLSGEPYITHCAETARYVSEWKLGETTVAAALLHDVVEDTGCTIKDVEKEFGAEIAFLVNGLTKLKSIKYPAKADTEALRKLLISSARDLRILLIKLADRLNNVKTVEFLPPERREKFARETIEIYAPLAYRLGMQKLSGELEDLAFPYVYPEEYKWLTKEVKDDYSERQEYAQKVVPIVENALKERGIEAISIDSRAKRYYSLYKKLLRLDMNMDKVNDLVALRVIVKTKEECYATLGIIHQLWQPVPNCFKDYIARPKPNGYRSLHTTVFALNNKTLEIQIRTKEMHDENEFGIAAHWAYEQVKSSAEKYKNWTGVKDKNEMIWMEQLSNWQKSVSNQDDFLESLKTDFFKDRIFVLTPQNDVIDLPAGATPVDFAYRIHSDVGDNCVGAKVNGKIAPLDYELQTRDIVEIIIQKNKKPSEDWLRFVKTSGAKKHIRETMNEDSRRIRKKLVVPQLETRIKNEDRAGYLKEVTAVFGDMKINITFLESQTDHRGALSSVLVKSEVPSPDRIQKLMVRLKKVPGTKEANYKINR